MQSNVKIVEPGVCSQQTDRWTNRQLLGPKSATARVLRQIEHKITP